MVATNAANPGICGRYISASVVIGGLEPGSIRTTPPGIPHGKPQIDPSFGSGIAGARACCGSQALSS